MGGGLIQLVAYGAQDIYLTGQPQITFFKAVYRRHTNFAMESVEQTINGAPGLGNTVTITANRRGDLIADTYLEFPVGATYTGGQLALLNTNSYENFNVFQNVELEIGGQVIDRIFGDWSIVWSELVFRKGFVGTTPAVPAAGISITCDAAQRCNDPLAATLNNTKVGLGTGSGCGGGAVHVPLQFWYQNNPGLAIPLVALQYHEVLWRVLFSDAATNAAGPLPNFSASVDDAATAATVAQSVAAARFFVNYIYLDTTERRKFSQNAHEYLICQHQRVTNNVTNANFSQLLNFNHPVKYLIWRVFTNSGAIQDNAILPCGTYNTARITLNGQNRMSNRTSAYYEQEQVHNFWPCGGNQLTNAFYHPTANEAGRWSVYSFGVRPAEHQPSGTCNFSRIDTAQLVINGATDGGAVPTRFCCHAENYNVLRIMSGMGGLAYSN